MQENPSRLKKFRTILSQFWVIFDGFWPFLRKKCIFCENFCKKVWRLKYFAYLCNPKRKEWVTCGSSSVGRAQPCQGWGREFEPRLLLQKNKSAAMLTFVLKNITRRGSIICQSSLCTRSAFFFIYLTGRYYLSATIDNT